LAAIKDRYPINPASLYIHVPFCDGLCDYCDFFSVSVSAGASCGAVEMDLFVDAVIGDIEDHLAFFEIDEVPSVYVGGGTP